MRITISASYEEDPELRDVRVLTADIGNDESTGEALTTFCGLLRTWGHDDEVIGKKCLDEAVERGLLPQLSD